MALGMVTVSGKVLDIVRRPNSRAGNPRFNVQLEGGSYPTKTDSSVNYDVHNLLIGQEVTLTLDPQGRVVDLQEA